ncbi:MAG: PIG-L family deacetylase [Bradymonadales bacterium]|nr:PIG-L family deacetylase [Bradymonadales bacterium]
MRVLVVSAHPDDEVIGAGGTLARHAARGDELHWAIVTRAFPPLFSAEVIEVMDRQIESVQRCLGIGEVHRLGFPTVKLNTVPYHELSSALQAVVDRVRPEVVYTTPANDINQDHRIVHDVTLVATRPLPGCSVKKVLSYEIGPTTRYGTPSGRGTFAPSVFVDIGGFLDKKLELASLYATEMKEYPHPRSLKGLEIIARERGISVGLEVAECFELVREIVTA